jgi:hypothetical protein
MVVNANAAFDSKNQAAVDGASERQRSYGAIVNEDQGMHTGRYLFGDWQMHPALGFTAINSSAGFNAGSFFSYKLIEGHALHLEPGFLLTAFTDYVVFNFSVGARYDVTLPDTKIRPFAKFSVGPSFQTSGNVAVLNAFAGLGAIYPVNSRLDFRGEAGLTNLDGNAGFQMVAGVAF